MDVGGSFLELACVRIAVVPAGPSIPDARYDALVSHITSFRELPVNALPRRANPVSTPSASPSLPRSSTSSTIPSPSATPATALSRSHSALRDVHTSRHPPPLAFASTSPDVNPDSPALPSSPRNPDLDLRSPDVGASFRMRYELVYRDHSAALVMRPFSEWDNFHSTKIWGVFGILDLTPHPLSTQQNLLQQAADDFRASLLHFKHAAVRRLLVFVSPDPDPHPFDLNAPSPSSAHSRPSFSIGHIPEHANLQNVRLEVRAQVIHFAGLLLHEIDLECSRRRESPSSELFLSPIDEKLTLDRQSKLVKRRLGRLDKLLGDSLLLMGSPADALVKYSSAMERSKASGDRLWLAGAMEGWSAAHVLAHVGQGGHPNDNDLTNRLIEHYAEIYKLYQKKRVAEPEAAAAMRLAEFLSRRTSRRRAALDAAQHAAAVGEGLRAAKRAALWEALARFSDRMGHRRKAALYLYRLGELNASQGVLPSAVTLMVASERQLCTLEGRKPWAGTNRLVLMRAARHAEEGGHAHTSARLYAEALVTVGEDARSARDQDEWLVKMLCKAPVPAYMPAAEGIVSLEVCSPCQMQGLQILEDDVGNVGKTKEAMANTQGPFIYNPFEARKRAKAAAKARKAVTWVRDEAALVRVRLVSRVRAEVVADIVAILVQDEANGYVERSVSSPRKGAEECSDENAGESEVVNGGEGSGSGDEDIEDAETGASSRHAENVRACVERSAKIIETVEDSVTLHPYDGFGTTKYVSVRPVQTGRVRIAGVVVRLFSGWVMMLQRDTEREEDEEERGVTVMDRLPNVSVNVWCEEGEYGGEEGGGRGGTVVYDGEVRTLWVEVRNCGQEEVEQISGEVICGSSSGVRVEKEDGFIGEKVLEGVRNVDGVVKGAVEVVGQWTRRGPMSVGVVEFVVRYEGSGERVVRETRAQVRVTCRQAVMTGDVVMFDTGEGTMVAVETTNVALVPAKVVVQMCEEGEWVSGEDALLEHGACVRVMAPVKKEGLDRLLGRFRKGEGLRVQWSLPGIGREGVAVVDEKRVRRAAEDWREGGEGLRNEVSVRIWMKEKAGGWDGFRTVIVEVRNDGDECLDGACLMDVRAVGGRAMVVGLTKGLLVGNVNVGGKLSHSVKVRAAVGANVAVEAKVYVDGQDGAHVQNGVVVVASNSVSLRF